MSHHPERCTFITHGVLNFLICSVDVRLGAIYFVTRQMYLQMLTKQPLEPEMSIVGVVSDDATLHR